MSPRRARLTPPTCVQVRRVTWIGMGIAVSDIEIE